MMQSTANRPPLDEEKRRACAEGGSSTEARRQRWVVVVVGFFKKIGKNTIWERVFGDLLNGEARGYFSPSLNEGGFEAQSRLLLLSEAKEQADAAAGEEVRKLQQLVS